MEDGQGGGYPLTRDRIFYASGYDVDIIAGRRPRGYNDTPAWVSDPSFAFLASSSYAVAAAHPVRSYIKRARVDAAGEDDDDAAAIPGLRRVRGCSHSGDEDCCAICLLDLRADDTLGEMPCSHAFHHRCISQWIRRNAVCPLCRHRLPTDEGDDELEEEVEVVDELEEEVEVEDELEEEVEVEDELAPEMEEEQEEGAPEVEEVAPEAEEEDEVALESEEEEEVAQEVEEVAPEAEEDDEVEWIDGAIECS